MTKAEVVDLIRTDRDVQAAILGVLQALVTKPICPECLQEIQAHESAITDGTSQGDHRTRHYDCWRVKQDQGTLPGMGGR